MDNLEDYLDAVSRSEFIRGRSRADRIWIWQTPKKGQEPNATLLKDRHARKPRDPYRLSAEKKPNPTGTAQSRPGLPSFGGIDELWQGRGYEISKDRDTAFLRRDRRYERSMNTHDCSPQYKSLTLSGSSRKKQRYIIGPKGQREIRLSPRFRNRVRNLDPNKPKRFAELLMNKGYGANSIRRVLTLPDNSYLAGIQQYWSPDDMKMLREGREGKELTIDNLVADGIWDHLPAGHQAMVLGRFNNWHDASRVDNSPGYTVDVASILKRARAEFEEGNYGSAESTCLEITKTHPDSREYGTAKLLLAQAVSNQAHLALEDAVKAALIARAASVDKEKFQELTVAEELFLYKGHSSDDLISMQNRSLSEYRNGYYLPLAEALIKESKFSEALASYRHALDSSEKSEVRRYVEYMMDVCEKHVQSQELSQKHIALTNKAINAYTDALHVVPDSADIRGEIAKLHLRLGDRQSAIENLEIAVEFDPGLRKNLADLYVAAADQEFELFQKTNYVTEHPMQAFYLSDIVFFDGSTGHFVAKKGNNPKSAKKHLRTCFMESYDTIIDRLQTELERTPGSSDEARTSLSYQISEYRLEKDKFGKIIDEAIDVLFGHEVQTQIPGQDLAHISGQFRAFIRDSLESKHVDAKLKEERNKILRSRPSLESIEQKLYHAIELNTQMLDETPTIFLARNADLFAKLAEVYMYTGKAEAFRAAYSSARTLFSDLGRTNPQGLFSLAELTLLQPHSDDVENERIQIFQRIIDDALEDDAVLRAYELQAEAYHFLMQPGKVYDMGLKVSQDYSDDQSSCSVVLTCANLLRTTDEKKAVELYTEITTYHPLAPESFEAHYKLGEIMVYDGKPGQAVKHFDQIISYSDDPDLINKALVRAAEVFDMQGNSANAADYAMRAYYSDPTTPDAGLAHTIAAFNQPRLNTTQRQTVTQSVSDYVEATF